MPFHSFLGIFLVLLSLFLGCSREDKEEHAGSDISLLPEYFRIVSVEPEDAAEQVSIQTSLKVVFNSEIDQETVYPGSVLLLQNSIFIQEIMKSTVRATFFNLRTTSVIPQPTSGPW